MDRFQTILITGAGGGIGSALARASAHSGLDVVAADLDLEAASRTAGAVAEVGRRALALRLDVGDRDSVEGARREIRSRFGPIDVLVNNAGVVFGGTFGELPLDRHLATVRVNLLGAIAVTHTFLPDLLARPAAHLVNVASASGFLALPYGSSYASSKWGVIGFSESLRRELEVEGHSHVGVTTVCPGYADTGMFAGAHPPRTTRFLRPEEVADRTLRAIARNRPFVMTPWLVRLAPLLRGLVPTRAIDRISDLFGATRSMEHWRGHSDDRATGEAPGPSTPRGEGRERR